jgi:hypothetical protein
MFGVGTRLRERLVWTEVFLAIFVCVGSAGGRSIVPPGFTIAFTLANSTVTLHEPVPIEFSLDNESRGEVTIELGYNREGNVQFEIITPGGSAVSPPPLRRHGGISRYPELTLPVGQRYHQQLILEKWYVFPKPGDYRITVTLKATIRTGSSAPSPIEFAQQLAVKVDPRDPRRLAQVCARLAQSARSSDAETVLDAARLLSYADDVVAVPYLARLTREGPFLPIKKTIAFDGLVRIAKAQGPENVISHLGPEDRELRRELSEVFRLPPP